MIAGQIEEAFSMHVQYGCTLVRPIAAALLAVALGIGAASAQSAATFPTRPITIVVPYPPGGPPDVIARVLTIPLEKELGRPIIIDNKPGASTSLGTGYVARASADGYTLLAVEPTLVVAPHTLARAGFDPIKDFRPVSLTGRTYHTLGVATNVPAQSLADLLKLANAKPEEVKIGHSGVGTTPYLSALSFLQATKAPIQLVPYRGAALAVGDVVGGHISGVFTGPSTTGSLAKQGKLKILGVTGRQRLAAIPDVPTFLESGIEMKGVNDGIWFGLVAPAATPDDIVAKLNAAIHKASKDSDVIAKLESQGIFAVATTPEEMGKQVASELAHWRQALLEAGVKPSE
jgi:tripartite-type tricarboxylate transporter receptor subunit TctC